MIFFFKLKFSTYQLKSTRFNHLMSGSQCSTMYFNLTKPRPNDFWLMIMTDYKFFNSNKDHCPVETLSCVQVSTATVASWNLDITGVSTGQWFQTCIKIGCGMDKTANMKIMEWTFQSPDLYPTENLWTILKSLVPTSKPIHLNKVYQFCKEESLNIQPELWQKLVNGSQKHLVKVQLAQGYLTKH